MEEINRPQVNSQIPTQNNQAPVPPPEQPSKKWLIKYLLAGILGGIPFGIIIGSLSVFITLFLASLHSEGPMNLGAIVAVVAFFFYGPIAWVIFFISTIFIGYRRHINLPSGEKPPPLVMELLILVMGGGAGFLAVINSFQNSLQFLLEKIGLVFYILVIPLSIALASYLFLKTFHILMSKYPRVTLRVTLVSLILLVFAGLIVGRIWWLNIEQRAYVNRLNLNISKQELDKILPAILLSPAPIATQSSQFCIQDSDCSAGQVCTGRGPAQPSVEVPGVCVTSKQSQGVQ